MSTPNLLLKERHALIQQRLLAEGRVLALDLATQLNVSEDTIRRDLRDLAAAGLCKRVYGGALPLPPTPGTLSERRSEAPDRKGRLAQAAIGLVRANSVLFFDAGSTNLAIAEALPDLPLTVATNAPAIAIALLDRANIEVILIGGRIDRGAGASLGAKALRDAELIRADLCFLGACGVDADAGITAFSHEEAEFKRAVAAMSQTVLVAATSEKLGTAAPFSVLPAARLSHLVVEHDVAAERLDAFAALGVQLLRARPA
ncbi:DeoR/GlpR family DNA-binding transcription regulator [Janthinobacterium fluminis]|uniref:DeoR/GlpR family DNA-binding transcription regulator n=1 Tax=Janthinobacterium fluminis TaxID=2987524 RepID=A0ABT5K497_9BURK|nr:DeoR/GlpR family DNA-binding transcription regulator [Janthinobacterium fluminis]MDC8759525.1 DeoR/GlpR family DNA-binding transcription regulator [Janthinobacterium fluminis]